MTLGHVMAAIVILGCQLLCPQKCLTQGLSTWEHRQKAKCGMCLWSQHFENWDRRIDVSPSPTRLCDEILSQKHLKETRTTRSIHCVLVNVVKLSGSRVTKETRLWANEWGVLYIKLSEMGVSILTVGSPIPWAMRGNVCWHLWTEWATLWHKVLQSCFVCRLPVEPTAVLIILPFIRKKILLLLIINLTSYYFPLASCFPRKRMAFFVLLIFFFLKELRAVIWPPLTTGKDITDKHEKTT